jgi:hypothetical protein
MPISLIASLITSHLAMNAGLTPSAFARANLSNGSRCFSESFESERNRLEWFTMVSGFSSFESKAGEGEREGEMSGTSSWVEGLAPDMVERTEKREDAKGVEGGGSGSGGLVNVCDKDTRRRSGTAVMLQYQIEESQRSTGKQREEKIKRDEKVRRGEKDTVGQGVGMSLQSAFLQAWPCRVLSRACIRRQEKVMLVNGSLLLAPRTPGSLAGAYATHHGS